MFRIFGFVALLIVLLLVSVSLKHQLAAQRGLGAVQAGAMKGSDASQPDVNSPAQGRQVQQQVQDDVNRIMQEHSKQLEQNVERSAP